MERLLEKENINKTFTKLKSYDNDIKSYLYTSPHSKRICYDISNIYTRYSVTDPMSSNNPLPETSWGDKNQIWQKLKESDSKFMLNSNFLLNHTDLNINMLQILFEWLSEVCGVLKLKRVTFYLCIHLIYNYLNLEKNVNRNLLQLIGITCLFISTKMEEIYPPRIKTLSYFTDDACSVDKILLQELYCLEVLNWEINILKVIDWVGIYIQIINNKFSNTPIKCFDISKPLLTDNHILVNIFHRIAQITDLCICDIKSVNFSYSMIAASVLSYFVSYDYFKNITGYHFNDIQPCIKWLYPNIYIICAQSSYNYDIFPYMDGKDKPIPLSEQIHIHTHTVRINLLDEAIKLQSKLLECDSFIYNEISINESCYNLLTPPTSSKKKKIEDLQ